MSPAPCAWIDTHTHLNYEYPFTVDEYLVNARAQGVCAFVTIGTEPDAQAELKDLAEAHSDVYFTVGIHPHEAKDFTPAVEKEMDELRRHPKCVGVGEIGLDYHYNHSDPAAQRLAFEKQLALASAWQKPAVIHARDAEDDIAERLEAYVKAMPPGHPCAPGIIHCFSGTRAFADRCLALGFYISFSGIVTFKNATSLREVAKSVPLDRILLETDSPYLAPMPHRGKPNQSAYLVETAKIIAQVRGLALESLSSATVANSRAIFKLPAH